MAGVRPVGRVGVGRGWGAGGLAGASTNATRVFLCGLSGCYFRLETQTAGVTISS